MLKDKYIICISSIDWDFVWQGHQEIMSTLAANGNTVLFIENTGVRIPNFKDLPRLRKRLLNWLKSTRGFRRERENLYVYSPLILPFPYFRFARWINRYFLLGALEKWMRIMGFNKPIIWTFLPTGTALDIINNIENKLVIYYCIANFYELSDNINKVKNTENDLIIKSDLIFAQGIFLKNKCQRLNSNVHIFPFGVKIEAFQSECLPQTIPQDLKEVKKPIIGYIGGIHKHIDFNLLKHISKTHPEWSLVLIGPLQTNVDEFKNFKNVFFLGKKEFPELAGYINEFDVCIIPYLKTEYTQTVYPTKLNEYHAMGKPVVSTDLPEVLSFNEENENLVFVAKGRDEFIGCIKKALSESGDLMRVKRIHSARKNSWTNRIEEMSGLIEKEIIKKSNSPFDWKESLLRLSRVSKRKAWGFISFCLIVYLIMFYTPLVWLIGKPLIISQLPQKADAIVTFAGGVGESGKEGQGYEERVQYAVELYKKGYASHMIFSSGYMYIFKEPLVMKALAISMGVPEEAIILEDKAKMTYENVIFTKKILDKNGWHKILLVTSPYHNLRSRLVFNKYAPDLKVIYTSIPNSRFYSNPPKDERGKIFFKRIKPLQIKGIFHEYLGILYYWLKGYI